MSTGQRISDAEFRRVLALAVQCAGKPFITAQAIKSLREPEPTRWRWIVMATFRRARYSTPAIAAHFGCTHHVPLHAEEKTSQKPLSELFESFAKMAAVAPASDFSDDEGFVRDGQATVAGLGEGGRSSGDHAGDPPSFARLEGVRNSCPTLPLSSSPLREAGDALGAVLAAAADAWRMGDVASWRRVAAAAERLALVARAALPVETVEEIVDTPFGQVRAIRGKEPVR